MKRYVSFFIACIIFFSYVEGADPAMNTTFSSIHSPFGEIPYVKKCWGTFMSKNPLFIFVNHATEQLLEGHIDAKYVAFRRPLIICSLENHGTTRNDPQYVQTILAHIREHFGFVKFYVLGSSDQPHSHPIVAFYECVSDGVVAHYAEQRGTNLELAGWFSVVNQVICLMEKASNLEEELKEVAFVKQHFLPAPFPPSSFVLIEHPEQ